jgi:hypothetical protein
MKTIARRLRLLENRVASHEIGGPSPVEVLRERRRRRLEASGLPYEERAPESILYELGRRPTCAEVLRSARTRRCADAESGRAEKTEPNLTPLGSVAEE